MILDIIQTLLLLTIGYFVIINKPHNFKIKPSKERKAVLDSCALIDGRIIELAQAGFVPGNLVIPTFIVAELQLLADGTDSHKRERARFGLEVVQQLQREKTVDVIVDRSKVQGKTIDDKLVDLAKKIGADLYTTDFNLNQVASIEEVKVLNVNELSHALRPITLPGESLEVKILQSGSNHDQGVGYLEDGTMIVIDNAKRDIGKKIKVEITRTHQTVAGKMIFARKIVDRPHTSTKNHHDYRLPKTKPHQASKYK